MNKNIILLLTSLVFIGCGGGSGGDGGNTESSGVVDENISNILGIWYLPNGCSYGIETAKLTISESGETNKLFMSFDYYDDNNDAYTQYLSNVDVVESSVSSNGDISFKMQPEKVTGSSGAYDLYISQNNIPLRIVNNKLEISSLCLEKDESKLVRDSELEEMAVSHLLGESLAIRDFYKTIFDEAWKQTVLDFARRGARRAGCGDRLVLVNDYLNSLFRALNLNEIKFHIFDSELSDGWIDQVYLVLYELDLQELSTCDAISDEITARYALGY